MPRDVLSITRLYFPVTGHNLNGVQSCSIKGLKRKDTITSKKDKLVRYNHALDIQFINAPSTEMGSVEVMESCNAFYFHTSDGEKIDV